MTLKTREPNPQLIAAARPTRFKARRSWRDDEVEPACEPGMTASEQYLDALQPGSTFSQPGSEPGSTFFRTRFTPGSEPGSKFTEISVIGNERKVLWYIFNSCRHNGSLLSPFITKSELRDACKCPTESLRTAIKRLEAKNFLKRTHCENGRTGGNKFLLSEEVFQTISLMETRFKPGSNPTEPGSEPGSKSSTGGGSINIDLRSSSCSENSVSEKISQFCSAVDPSPVIQIGFTDKHVQQMAYAGHLTCEQLQDSIHHFAFELEVNKKTLSSPLNYFMKCLRNGPYPPPANYESPDLRQMRQYLEGKEREQKVRADLEARLELVEFESWLSQTSLEERVRLVPPKDFAPAGGNAHLAQVKTYFRENIWPGLRQRIEQGKKFETTF